MSNQHLVNRCLMGAALAVPATLFGIFKLGFAQEPLEVPAPRVLRVAQADTETQPKGESLDLAAMDVPGGMALNPEAKKRISAGVGSCGICHSKSGASDPIPAIPNQSLDDGWCLLNEARTWGTLDKHYGSYAVLLNDRSQQMAKILGIVDPETKKSVIHRDQRCLACHSGLPIYEMDANEQGLVSEDLTKKITLNRGVSCEGCHGPASVERGTQLRGWISEHYGNPDWRYMDPKVKASEYGYYDVRSPVSRTRMCVSCHVGNAREGRVVTHEMYAAGHPPLPGFELETFSDQEPEHWRNFRNKPEKVREEWLEETGKTWRKTDWDEKSLEDAPDALIAACVSLAEYARLNADLADTSVEFPLKSNHWSSETWPELSQFACYACHHDLRAEGWRIQRTPVGVPGRPPLYEWPTALVEVAARTTGADRDKILGQIHDMQMAAVDGPFGNRDKLIQNSRQLAAELDKVASQLEQKTFSKDEGQKLLNEIGNVAASRLWDYDSARQLVWAYRIAYEELMGNSPSVEELYDKKELGQVPGWYEGQKKLDPVQSVLATFDDLLLLDLRKGRVKQGKLSERDQLPYLEWQPEFALPNIGKYNPKVFQEKMSELQKARSANSTAKTNGS